MVTEDRQGRATRVSAIILAAGKGKRLGGIGKAFLKRRDGRTLLESDIEGLRGIANEFIVGIGLGAAIPRNLVGTPGIAWTKGGSTRLETLCNAMEAANGEILLIWDVARPRVPPDMVRELLDAAAEHGAAMPVLRFRTRESLGVEKDGWLLASFPRDGLFLSQTPQAYRTGILRESLEKASAASSETVSVHAMVRNAGFPVRVIEGSPQNVKLTFPDDLEKYLGWPNASETR